MSASAADVVVIVPVRNRRDLLRRTLDALDRQEVDGFEVVVVDDGSTDGADEEATASPVRGRPVRLLRSDGQGAVAARRLAVASTDAPRLAFTDSDCEPDPTWLGAALDRLDAGADLVHGRTMPTRPVRPLERSVNEGGGGLFPTCNLAVTRAAYDSVGGFDPHAGSRWGFRPSARAKGLGFGEDTTFGWAVARRFRADYEEAMVVRHHVFEADLREWVGRSWQVGAFPALVREVPELRQTMLRHGVLFTARSRVPVYATLLALVTRRPALIAIALGWWVLHRYRRTVRPAGLPLADQARVLPAELLLDLIQAGALVAGSVRARTLLL